MGSCYKSKVIKLAEGEVGYSAESGTKRCKYYEELDKVDFFVGCGKKNGLDWCTGFVCWLIYKAIETLTDRAEDARFFMYQSSACNMAAVVKYMADYFKKASAYFTDSKNLATGDFVFFKNSNGLSHVGICVDWNGSGFYTVEGNTNGGKVARKFYSYSVVGGRVAGFGRPRYDKEPDSATVPSEPEEKKSDLLIVTTKVDPLTIRSAPSTSSMALGSIPKGTELKTNTFCNGDFVHGDNTWFKVTYKGVTGFVAGYYLTRS